MIPISGPSEFSGSSVPTAPGVYFFRDEKGEILYVGKAKSLRSRVSSYFSRSQKPPKTAQLALRVRSIDWIVVNNEVEALLLENKMIKQHSPRYNISLKDAKTYAYIALSKEPFPRILTSRKVSPKLESFGPYTDGFLRQELQRLVVKIFRIRVCRKLPKRACLNFHMDLCTAPCVGNVGKGEYLAQVSQARSFLSGNYSIITKSLMSQMKDASGQKRYERALELRNQIASIQLLTRRQIVDNERKFDQDVMAFRRLGDKMVIVQMGIRKGVLLGKKDFSIDLQPQIEQEFLKAFYSTNKIPREVLLSGACWSDETEKSALEEFLSSKRGAPVTLSVPNTGGKLSLVRLAEKNLESGLGEDSALVDLQANLNLPTLPRVIECFDVSNLGSENVVSGMVRFRDAKPEKSGYRRFRIRTFKGQDDFASMGEVVTRRYKRLAEEKSHMPDLVVVDGGLGQVGAAESAIRALGLQIPLIGLAKENEEIHIPGDSVPRVYDKNGRMMLLLRKIRDAAHGFSLGYNIRRRKMNLREEFKSQGGSSH